MKNTIISILVLVIIIFLGWFLLNGDNKVEAPTESESDSQNQTGAVNNSMPVLEEEGDEVVETEAVREFVVTGQNFSFDPATITVKKGERVRIIFKNSQGFHDFVIDEYGAATKKTQAPTEEVIEFTADKVGSFEYYCSVGSHRQMGMKGTLIVEE